MCSNCSTKLFVCELKHDDFNEISFKNLSSEYAYASLSEKQSSWVGKILDWWLEHVGSSPGSAPQNGNLLWVFLQLTYL